MSLRLALPVLLLSAAAALAQTDPNGFVVQPLPDLPQPGEPGQGAESSGEGFGFSVNPEMGLEGTGVPDQNGGFVTTPDAASGQDGVFVQINPGGQDGVALIQAPNGGEATSVNRVAAEVAPGAMLRGLDKTIGSRTDFEMEQGETVVFGRLAIRMLECRYPADNPASDAFAHLQIADLDGQEIFDGWMVASSPALMALEHPRYDVWVLSCSTS